MGQIEVVQNNEGEGKDDKNMKANELSINMGEPTAGGPTLNNEHEYDQDMIYDQRETQNDFEIFGDDEIMTPKGNYT